MKKADKISIKLDNQTNKTLETLSAKQNISKPELIRKFINQGLDKELTKESIDYIRENIHDEIENICNPQFERIAKLNAKIGFQSVSNFYLLAYIIESILPTSKRKDFDEIKKKSKMVGIAYLKLRDKEFKDFMESEDISLDMLDLK